MGRCPGDEELGRHAGGHLEGAERSALEEHLATCPSCRARLEEARADEGLLAGVRGAWRDAPEAAEGPADPPDLGAPLPSALGRYRLIRRIGAGGMGIVYEAEQSRPHRRVALKVLRSELVSERMLRRFEHEVELLGRLDHPGIARVHEADTFESPHGRLPFFAMELVEGRPLTEHVAAEGTDRRGRLELLLSICDAVEHAHRQGVIHRDLKPSNVLVTPDGQPKILDLGIGRALDADPALTTLRTESGQLLGTLPYMSPEQVSGDPGSVDTRADVYALGVILYELLAGRLPVDVGGRTLADGIRALLEQEPAPLGALDSNLRGDLETIAAKALEKDRERRYGSAAALAEDLRRHLRSEPIAARPHSTLYQLRKFARRHRALVLGAQAVLLVLVVGLATTTAQMLRARRAEREWERAAMAAREEKEQAEREAARATKVSDLMQELLLQASPEQVQGEPTLSEMLHEAGRRAATDLEGEPDLEAELLNTLGRGFLALGAYGDARQQLDRALSLIEEAYGADDSRLTAALVTLAQLELKVGDYDAAERHVQRALGLYGGDRSRHEMSIATSLNSLAIARFFQGDLEDAERLFRDALAGYRRATGEASPDVATTLANLAKVVHTRGRLDEAAELLARAVPMTRETMGSTNPHLASALLKLAAVALDRGEAEAAETHAREALDIYRGRLGDEHPSTADALVALGKVRLERGETEGVLEDLARALEIRIEKLGAQHPKVTEALAATADALVAAGAAGETEPRLRASLERCRNELGDAVEPDHPARRVAELLDGLGGG